MGVVAASGHPKYSGTYIPELWAPDWNVKFYDAAVVQAISNTNWQGLIKNQGDVVKIRQKADLVIRELQKGGTLKVQRPESSNVELNIDKAYYFNAILDDIDAVQSDMDLISAWNSDATEQMAKKIDTAVLQDIYDDVSSDNCGTTAGVDSNGFNFGTSGAPASVAKTDIIEFIVDGGTILDEQNVPNTKRWWVMNPLFIGMMKKSELRDASITGDTTSVARNGRVGTVDRFTFYSSNLLKAVSADLAWYMLFGHPAGLTFASQLVKNESLKSESTFGQLIRGLQVLGYKVNHSVALGTLYAAKA